MEDAAIVALYWARDEQALAETAAKFGAYCRKIADNILHSAHDAEECENDTWLAAWNSMPTNRPARLAPYLGRITRNLALDRFDRAAAQKRGSGEKRHEQRQQQNDRNRTPSDQTVEMGRHGYFLRVGAFA